MRRRNIKQINDQFSRAAEILQSSNQQFQQFQQFANQYKGKSKKEIEEEMNQLMKGFSREQKDDLIKKLQILKEMDGVLDSSQKKQVDMFVQMLLR